MLVISIIVAALVVCHAILLAGHMNGHWSKSAIGIYIGLSAAISIGAFLLKDGFFTTLGWVYAILAILGGVFLFL